MRRFAKGAVSKSTEGLRPFPKAFSDEREALLRQAHECELALRQEQPRLEEARKALDLELARRLDEERPQMARARAPSWPRPTSRPYLKGHCA